MALSYRETRKRAAGEGRLQESAKTSSKTIAKQAEQKRRQELEEGFNRIEDHREEGIRTIRDVGKEISRVTLCEIEAPHSPSTLLAT